jgi:hypothetical protein
MKTGVKAMTVAVCLAAALLAAVLAAPGASAQTPEGATCEEFPIDPPVESGTWSFGDFELAVIEFDDGSTLEIPDITDGTEVTAPEGTMIVAMFKCALAEEETEPPAESGEVAEEEELADTGSEPGLLVVLGVALLGAGVLLTGAGFTRRPTA